MLNLKTLVCLFLGATIFASETTPTCELKTYSCKVGTCYKIRISGPDMWSSEFADLSETPRNIYILNRKGLCHLPNTILPVCQTKSFSCSSGVCYAVRVSEKHLWSNEYTEITGMAEAVFALRPLCVATIEPRPKCEVKSYSCKTGSCYVVRATATHFWSNEYKSISELEEDLQTLEFFKVCKN